MTTTALAACSDNPDMWFSTLPSNVRAAKAICDTCPIRTRCLEETLEYERLSGMNKHGVFGGLTPAERVNLLLPKE